MTPSGLTEADLEDFAGRVATQPGGLLSLSDDADFEAFARVNLLDGSPGGPTPRRLEAVRVGRAKVAAILGERLGVEFTRTFRGAGGRFLSPAAVRAGAKVTGSIPVVRDLTTGRFRSPGSIHLPEGQFRSGHRQRAQRRF